MFDTRENVTGQDAVNRHDAKLRQLIEDAEKSGATALAIISTRIIAVDDDLADRCREPRCENYGLSRSCPPHVPGPSVFRRKLEEFNQAIFLRIDVPSEVLYSSEGRQVFQLLHEVVAGIERSAVKMGFARAQAYAGGSCKKIFCHDHPGCLALAEKGECRNPEYARPSMSGFGINVAKLYEAAGWTMGAATRDSFSTGDKTASVCGLVLVY
jgi:predicted metal-binding protein